MAETGTVMTTTSETPEWYDQLAQQFGTQIGAGLTSAAGTRNQWYTGPRVEGMSDIQQNVTSSIPGVMGAGGPQYLAGWGAMQQGAQDVAGTGTWDPATMASHVSPYIGGVVDEIARLGNRNLTENIIPGINTTFAGAGQFGSTRNADFMNRAVRDTSADIAGKQAGALQSAWTQAAQDYNQWDANQRATGTTLGNLGTAMGQYGVTGQNMRWEDLANAWKYGAEEQNLGQKTLDQQYADWVAQLQAPTTMMSQLAPMMQQISSIYRGTDTGTYAPSDSSNDLMAMIAALLT